MDVLTFDGEAAHPITVEQVSSAKVRLACACGWSRGCRSVSANKWANAHWRSLAVRAVGPDDCPLCGRRKAMAVGMVDDRPVRYCRWVRWRLCEWPGPVPPKRLPIGRDFDPCPDRDEGLVPIGTRVPWRPPEDQDDAIAWMVKWRDEGLSMRAIARQLDAGGFPPPMRGGRGGSWSSVTVKRYLAWHDGVTLPKWWQ